MRWLADRLLHKSVTNPDSHLVFYGRAEKRTQIGPPIETEARPCDGYLRKLTLKHTWLGAHYKYRDTTFCHMNVHEKVETPLV